MRRAAIPRRTSLILIALGMLAILIGGVALGVATSATDWLMARLARSDLAIDAAALGGATAALGAGALITGAGLFSLAVALQLGRRWARPATAVVAFGLLAALLGSLGASVASWVRDPGNGLAYGAVGLAAAIGMACLALVLLDVLRAPLEAG